MFNEYPYRNIEDLNLDYLQARVRNLEKIVEQFVALESVTFADPIQWNITTQYAKNTVVLDSEGDAFISIKPVPIGVYLNNGEYWLEIFNFMDYVKSFNSNLTFNIEYNTNRASVAYSVGDWLLIDDVLYKVLVAIPADALFEIGVNIEHFTVEDFIKAWINYANGLIVQYKNDIDASEVAYRNQLAQDIASTTNSLQAQLNAAIAGATVDSEVINARIDVNGVTFDTLGDAIRTQIENIPTHLQWTSQGRYSPTSPYSYTGDPNYRSSCEFPIIRKNRTIYFHGKSSASNILVVAYFDSNGNIIGGESAMGTDNTEIALTIPDGAESFRVTSHVDYLKDTYIRYDGTTNNPIYCLHRDDVRISKMIETSDFDDSQPYRIWDIVKQDNELYQFFMDYSSGGIDNSNSVAIDIVQRLAQTMRNFNASAGVQFSTGYINRSGVVVPGSAVRQYSGYIPILPASTITYIAENNHSTAAGITFWDIDGNFISDDPVLGTLGEPQTVTAPDTAFYIRLSTIRTIGMKAEFTWSEHESALYFISNTICKMREFEGQMPIYVDGITGSDTNDGTASRPFKTINHALKFGTSLIVAPAVYNEKIAFSNKSLSITPRTYGLSFDQPYTPKITIVDADELTVSLDSGNIYKAPFTADVGTNIYKIYVTGTLTPTTTGDISLEYNALLFGDNPDTTDINGNVKQRLFTPVLTEAELSVEGTFWYNGVDTVKFHPYDDTPDSHYYIAHDSATRGIYLLYNKSIHLEDVRVIGFYDNCVYINGAHEAEFINCDFGLSAKKNGIQLNNVNARLVSCHAFGNSADGFNFHEYGDSVLENCTSFYNGDDGCSHHQGCSGQILGGEYAYNVDGGVTPSFGARVNINNAYSHHNKRGFCYYGLSGYTRDMILAGSLSIDNTTDVYMDNYNNVVAYNNVYHSKSIGSRASFVEYNNNII